MKRILSLLFLVAAVVCVCPLSGQSRAHRINIVLQRGSTIMAKVVPYARISVCVAGTSCTPVPIFSNAALTTPLIPPVVAESSGNYSYYVAPGCYDEVTSATGATTVTTPNACVSNQTSGGGSAPVGPQYHISGYTGSGSGSTTPLAQTNATTDSTGNPLNVPRNVATPSVAAYNPNLPLNFAQAQSFTASDYAQRDASGNITGGIFEPHTPWNFTQYEWARYACCDVYQPHTVTLNLQGGLVNSYYNNGNIGMLGMTLNSQVSGQNGGTLNVTVNQHGVGDFIGSTFTVAGRGKSRAYDESGEMKRWFIGINNATFGGNATIGSVTAQGNQPFHLANPSTYGYSFAAAAEEMPFVNITRKFASPGNIKNIALWATNTRYIEITGDAASAITSTYGVSSFTTTTAVINSNIYTGSCPTWVDTGATPPGGDAFITDRTGVNVWGLTHTNSPSNYCVPVESSAGMTPGTTVYITDSNFAPEYTTVASIADGTHFVANIKHPHAGGAVVSWGGGVGYGFSSAHDDRAVGTSTNAVSTQSAITHLVYPIMLTETSNKVVVDVLGIDFVANDFKSLAYANNAPIVPLTMTIDARGNVASSNSSTADYRTANVSGGTGHIAGPLEVLPAPVLTFTCTSNPTISLAIGSSSTAHPTYVPTTTATGSGCTGVTVAATAPNPFNIYPMTWTYRVTDPASVDKKMWSISGYVLTDPLAASSAWHAGDQVESTRWWQSFAGGGQETYQQDDDIARSANFGTQNSFSYSGAQSGAAEYLFLNLEPVAHYLGKFTNPYGYGPSTVPSDSSMGVGPLFELSNANGGLARFDEPPLGAMLNVFCNAVANDPLKDHPCAHGIHNAYALWSDTQNGPNDYITVNPATHVTTIGEALATNQINAAAISTSGLTIVPFGTTNFQNAHSQSVWNPQVCAPSIFGASPIVFNCSGPPNTVGGDRYTANPQMNLWLGYLRSTLGVTAPSVDIGWSPPTKEVTATHVGMGTGTARRYAVAFIGPLGIPGATTINPPLVVLTGPTLSGKEKVNVTCPSSYQVGWPAGTYELYTWLDASFNTTRDLGPCALSAVVVDDGTITAVHNGQGPLNNANDEIRAGWVTVQAGGALRFRTDVYDAITDAGFSRPTAGVTSVDGAAVGDGLGTIKAATAVLSGKNVCLADGTNCPILVASLSTTAATSDNVTITGMTASGHCNAPGPTNAAAATNIATTYVSAKAANSITVTHAARAAMTYDITCTPY